MVDSEAISFTIGQNPRDWTAGHAQASTRSPSPAKVDVRRQPEKVPDAAAADYVSLLKFGSPSEFSQLLTVTLSVVNSPVQMSTPMAISTAPPIPMMTG